MKTYVVISFNDDGDPPSVTEMSGDELRKRLREQYWESVRCSRSRGSLLTEMDAPQAAGL